MSRSDNVKIFEDTTHLYSTNERLIREISDSVDRQTVILENDILPEIDLKRYDVPAEVIVSGKRTLEAAKAYTGRHVAVHNFASASHPGGGVVRGSTAQEECICRCSTLYSCLTRPRILRAFYHPHREQQNPWHNDDIIYTPAVSVFKSDTDSPELLPEEEWYNVDVITCAAPNLRDVDIQDNEQQILYDIHVKRLSRILDAAVLNDADTVILGAFGCGAFKNSPWAVAKASKAVIAKYKYAFKTIEFAVLSRPATVGNYEIFSTVIKYT